MPRGRGQRERDATVARAAILDAATTVFARDGFDGARVDRIADASGYAKALIFHHFGDKASLYEAVMEWVRRQMAERMVRQLAPFVANEFVTLDARLVRGFLETFIGCYFDFLVEHPETLRILGWEIGDQWQTFVSQAVPEEMTRQLARGFAFVRTAQEAGLIRAEIDPPVLLASMAGLTIFHLLSLPRYRQVLGSLGATWDDELGYLKRQIVRLVLDGALPHHSVESWP